MQIRRFFMLAVLGLVAACSNTEYPYAPQYVSPDNVPPTSVPVPPPAHSAQWKRDIDTILELQRTMTPERKAQVMEEAPVRPEMVLVKVMGPDFNRQALPKTYTLLDKVGSDTWRISDAAKDYWNTTRPWLSDSRVQLFVPAIYSHSYPSGHTTTSHVWAGVLADAIPCQREALFKRAATIGLDREYAGAHYASDVAAGKLLASKIVAFVETKPNYQQDLNAARAELKRFMQARYRSSKCAHHCPGKNKE